MVQLVKLNGGHFPGKVNGSRFKLYTGGLAMLLYEGSTILVLQVAERRCETINYTAWFRELQD